MKRTSKRSRKTQDITVELIHDTPENHKENKKKQGIGRKIKKSVAMFLCVLFVFLPITTSAYDGSKRVENGIWNVRTSEIVRELRLIGNLNRILIPQFDEKIFRLGNLVMDTFMEGINLVHSVNFEEEYIETDTGRIRLCIYTPEGEYENVPGLLWIHGGGFAMGMPEQDHSFIKDFMSVSPCVIIAPDYTNSTNAPYPAAFNDCYDSLLWMKDNAAEYGINTDQLFVGGNSAGGNLCAAVTLKARDRGDVNIAFQMPLYPMLDDRMITPSSQNNDAPTWNSKSNENAWKLYLGEDYGTDNVHKYASPARETDYSALPPTLTFVGTIEPFYDETVIYVENLKNAGNEVMFEEYEGCFHAFDILHWTNVAKQARGFLKEGFGYAAENYFAPQN